MEISSSPEQALNVTDWKKGLRGAAITYVAGLVVIVLNDLAAALNKCVEGICQVDLGMYDFLLPIGISALGLLIEMVRRWRANFQSL